MDDYSDFDASVLLGGERPLFYLAAALRRGDLAEATRRLDEIGQVCTEWQEEIEQGRFSPEGRG